MLASELDVCCHTCHRFPGQPCRWSDGSCPVRVRHFANKNRHCTVCGPGADRAQVDAFARFGILGPDHAAYLRQRGFVGEDGVLTAAGQAVIDAGSSPEPR